MIDTGSAAVIGSVLLLAGTMISTRAASRKGTAEAEQSKEAEQKVVEQVAATSFRDNLALTQYIREQVREGVAAETEQLRRDREADRRDLEDVKRILGNVYGRLERIRQAVREYIADVRAQWGKGGDEPPPVNRHLTELLDDVDDDTWTRVRIAQLNDGAPPREDEPQNYG